MKKINNLRELRQRKAELRESIRYSGRQIRERCRLPSASKWPSMWKIAVPALGGLLLTGWLRKKVGGFSLPGLLKTVLPLLPMLYKQLNSHKEKV